MGTMGGCASFLRALGVSQILIFREVYGIHAYINFVRTYRAWSNAYALQCLASLIPDRRLFVHTIDNIAPHRQLSERAHLHVLQHARQADAGGLPDEAYSR
jgi:hypothetical protein